MKKALTFFIVVLFTVAFLPLDACCHDDHKHESHHVEADSNEQSTTPDAEHHCIALCFNCFHVSTQSEDVVISSNTYIVTEDTPFFLNRIYQDPSLPTDFRPPIQNV